MSLNKPKITNKIVNIKIKLTKIAAIQGTGPASLSNLSLVIIYLINFNSFFRSNNLYCSILSPDFTIRGCDM